MNTTTGQLTTLQDALELMAASLVLQRRSDGTEYRALAESAPRRAELQDVVQECHRGELPNDWRFETLHSLCHWLLDASQSSPEAWDEDDYREVLPEAADALVEPYSGPLLQWLADNPSRAAFEEDYGSVRQADLLDMAAARQCEEIWLMGETLLSGLVTLLQCER